MVVNVLKYIIGVSGGIAIYKVVDLVRRFIKRGDEVKVVMTKSATKFVTAELFREISLNPVMTEVFGNEETAAHIKIAQWCDAMIIAPATANIIGKITAGIADDALSTVAIAMTKPLIIAPAMNEGMYKSAAVTANLATLKSRGIKIIEPDSGSLACGVEGVGRLPEPENLVKYIDKILEPSKTLSGCKIVVTAGGTREAIDPVRYIGNRSSGKMGHAIAQAASERGAEVVLITTSNLTVPPTVKVVNVESAEQMRQAVLKEYNSATAVIMAAAVADYRVAEPAVQKIKKSEDKLTLELIKNPDILLELGQNKQNQILIGFAAETQLVETNATVKLNKKNLDMIVANDVSAEGAGFGVDTNIVTLITKDGAKSYPKMTKLEVANIILDELERRFLL
ncbi:MAG: bifunctional phosphopantothenoylcysteine decarboxylase/phosphopantothenate--cysteine ligase CoaBC [Selenomonadaceae bacterium]|nr:bifunctional phosphopantothenoylcysteine decarboxylase/phosphopantothenate--cysteine ligase CoaBC [Selenomonadaceae bacterium]